MGKLDVARMSNSTKLGRVDNAHVALEADLEEILGVPDNTIITIPILGQTSDGEPPVQPDGSLRGIMRFYENGVISTVAGASGFEWTDGTVTKRVVLVDSVLNIYELDGTTWSKVASLETAATGKLTGLSDVDPSMTLVAGKVLSVNAGGGTPYFELIDPASGTGVSRFADLDDTPAAANAIPGDPFADGDVGSLVYVASTAALGFTPPPAGLGEPFVMCLATTGDTLKWNTLDPTETNWGYVIGWAPVGFNDDGGFLTDNTALITGEGVDGNVNIALEAGLYQISLWYTTTNPNKFGTRQWRIAGDSSDGPATYGIQQEANLYIPAGATDPEVLPGLHFLGTQMLIQYADDTIKFEVKQDSGTRFNAVYYSAVISKVK